MWQIHILTELQRPGLKKNSPKAKYPNQRTCFWDNHNKSK